MADTRIISVISSDSSPPSLEKSDYTTFYSLHDAIQHAESLNPSDESPVLIYIGAGTFTPPLSIAENDENISTWHINLQHIYFCGTGYEFTKINCEKITLSPDAITGFRDLQLDTLLELDDSFLPVDNVQVRSHTADSGQLDGVWRDAVGEVHVSRMSVENTADTQNKLDSLIDSSVSAQFARIELDAQRLLPPDEDATNTFVLKSGDTMTGMLSVPSNHIYYSLALGAVPFGDTVAYGSMNVGVNHIIMKATGVASKNAAWNNGEMYASGDGSVNIGHNSTYGIMRSASYGTLNRGYNYIGEMNAYGMASANIGVNQNSKMIADHTGAMNIGLNKTYSQMIASGAGSLNSGYSYNSVMAASGIGSMNRGYIINNIVTNAGDGSIALLDDSGNMIITNNATIVLGNGFSSYDRSLVADYVLLRNTPKDDNHAATKQYVDDNIGDAVNGKFVEKSGDTMSGTLDMQSNQIINVPLPVNAFDAVPKAYVLDVLTNGETIVYFKTNDVQIISNNFYFSGDLILKDGQIWGLSHPYSNDNAATKLYVDTQDGSLSNAITDYTHSHFVNKSGDSMTGPLRVNTFELYTVTSLYVWGNGEEHGSYYDTGEIYGGQPVYKSENDYVMKFIKRPHNWYWLLTDAEGKYISIKQLAEGNYSPEGQWRNGIIVYITTRARFNANNTRLSNIGEPRSSTDATTKNYVDTKKFGTANIADGAVTAAKLDDMGASSGQVLKWNGSQWQPAEDAGGMSQQVADSRYVNKSGDEMTGTLTINNSKNATDLLIKNNEPAIEFQKADNNRAQVRYDNQTAGLEFRVNGHSANDVKMIINKDNVGIGTVNPAAKLHVNGNVIVAEPRSDNHAATKKYVDDAVIGTASNVYVNLSGDTMTGTLTAPEILTTGPYNWRVGSDELPDVDIELIGKNSKITTHGNKSLDLAPEGPYINCETNVAVNGSVTAANGVKLLGDWAGTFKAEKDNNGNKITVVNVPGMDSTDIVLITPRGSNVKDYQYSVVAGTGKFTFYFNKSCKGVSFNYLVIQK